MKGLRTSTPKSLSNTPMDAIDPRKRHSLFWAWILLIPIVLAAAFCITFGPYLYQRMVVRRLESRGVRVDYIGRKHMPGVYTFIHSIEGFERYGDKLLWAIVSCQEPATNAELPQIASDLRNLSLPVVVDLTGPRHIGQYLKELQTTNIVKAGASECVISTAVIKSLQSHLELTDLVLSNCQLEDAAQRELGQLQSLESLLLNGSTITDEGLKHLKSLKKLTTLSLSNTQTSDGAKEELLKVFPDLQLSDD